MGDVAIRVEGLGKMYRLGATQTKQRYHTIRDQLALGAKNTLRALLRRGRRRAESKPILWALKDVSFEVKRGEVVGIIGRNGAGKSTLLKILSRITEPTEGGATIWGRVGSLLEVGTGFNPELTGRENIFLNGAILGMTRAEIARKFDEIVAFAEVEKFIDTPVKRYSSGMYTRLAFAVAAHLEPEILVVDEVLAVGDAEFQKKCLGKMGDVAKGGRTVLFVSHNMGAIGSLCQTGIVLAAGRIAHQGAVNEAIDAYNTSTDSQSGHVYVAEVAPNKPHFRRIAASQEGIAGPPFRMDRAIRIQFEIETGGVGNLTVGVRVRNAMGVTVIHSTDEFAGEALDRRSATRTCTLPAYTLAAGTHYVRAGLFARGRQNYEALEDVLCFQVEFTGPMSGRSAGQVWHGVTGPGLVCWAT